MVFFKKYDILSSTRLFRPDTRRRKERGAFLVDHSFDVLIAGAGYAGAVAARILAEAGKRVLVVERRSHIGETPTTAWTAPVC